MHYIQQWEKTEQYTYVYRKNRFRHESENLHDRKIQQNDNRQWKKIDVYVTLLDILDYPNKPYEESKIVLVIKV